jgi:hypothetical protein
VLVYFRFVATVQESCRCVVFVLPLSSKGMLNKAIIVTIFYRVAKDYQWILKVAESVCSKVARNLNRRRITGSGELTDWKTV